MSKKVSESELQKLIKDADIMEIITQQVDREQSEASKSNQLSDFTRNAKLHIKDQRDVLLISIKVR